jgi:hypothetical protein
MIYIMRERCVSDVIIDSDTGRIRSISNWRWDVGYAIGQSIITIGAIIHNPRLDYKRPRLDYVRRATPPDLCLIKSLKRKDHGKSEK